MWILMTLHWPIFTLFDKFKFLKPNNVLFMSKRLFERRVTKWSTNAFEGGGGGGLPAKGKWDGERERGGWWGRGVYIKCHSFHNFGSFNMYITLSCVWSVHGVSCREESWVLFARLRHQPIHFFLTNLKIEKEIKKEWVIELIDYAKALQLSSKSEETAFLN